MKKILTIGITTFGNKVTGNIIDFLKGQPVKVIISEGKENLSKKIPAYIAELQHSGVEAKYIFCEETGIANNRQHILDNIDTKYFYIIDNDDAMTGDLTKVVEYLNETERDAIYIRCYEDGKYMHIPGNFIYMCTWMQIFRTKWIRDLGGYVQSWNFIHEESATNINLRTNLQNKPYTRAILPKNYLTYQYHANSACIVSFDVSKVCEFINGIPQNIKIVYKQKFLLLFTNFIKKYIRIYRVNEKKEVIYINNFINGTYDDILRCIEFIGEELKRSNPKNYKDNTL